jgi:TusA-related sulfurtransferase
MRCESDFSGPYPLRGARTAIALTKKGDILSRLLTDPDCAPEVAAWCRMTGIISSAPTSAGEVIAA